MVEGSALNFNDVVVPKVQGGHLLWIVTANPSGGLSLMCRGNDWSVKNDWRAWHTTARIDSNDPSVSHFHGARNALWGGRWNTNRDLTLQEAVTVRAALITEATLIWFEATAMNEVAKETPQTLKCRQPDALVLGHGAFSVGASRG